MWKKSSRRDGSASRQNGKSIVGVAPAKHSRDVRLGAGYILVLCVERIGERPGRVIDEVALRHNDEREWYARHIVCSNFVDGQGARRELDQVAGKTPSEK